MNFDHLVKIIRSTNRTGEFIQKDDWPEKIDLHNHVWANILKLYTYTSTDSTEYELSFFYIGDDVVVSKPITGGEHRVSAHHSLEVNYQEEKGKYVRSVFLDEVVVDVSVVDEVPVEQEEETGFLFNIHSHPIHLNYEGERVYTFFSPTDIRTLLNSKYLLTGLITDELWIACKTDQSISEIGDREEQLLTDLTVTSMQDESKLSSQLKEKLSEWGVVIYRADFDQDLIRVV